MSTHFYSRDKMINEKVIDLVRAGWLVKNGSKHRKLYTPDRTRMLTIPGSPSDHRSSKNWLRDIGRIEMNYAPPIKNKETTMNIELVTERPSQMNGAAKTKVLGNEHLPLIKMKLDQGETQGQIAKYLKDHGVRSRKGNDISQSELSRFLISHGVRRFEKKKRNRGQKKEVYRAVVPKPASGFLNEVMEIISSNLSDDAKERFLLMAFVERSSKR